MWWTSVKLWEPASDSRRWKNKKNTTAVKYKVRHIFVPLNLFGCDKKSQPRATEICRKMPPLKANAYKLIMCSLKVTKLKIYRLPIDTHISGENFCFRGIFTRKIPNLHSFGTAIPHIFTNDHIDQCNISLVRNKNFFGPLSTTYWHASLQAVPSVNMHIFCVNMFISVFRIYADDILNAYLYLQ